MVQKGGGNNNNLFSLQKLLGSMAVAREDSLSIISNLTVAMRGNVIKDETFSPLSSKMNDQPTNFNSE
jgi:hypothetical protein